MDVFEGKPVTVIYQVNNTVMMRNIIKVKVVLVARHSILECSYHMLCNLLLFDGTTKFVVFHLASYAIMSRRRCMHALYINVG